MINVETAALLAQIFPVGILAIALEARFFRALPHEGAAGKIISAILAALGLLAIVGGLGSVPICIGAVNDQAPLTGGVDVFVYLSGTLISVSVATLVGRGFVLALYSRDATDN